MQTCIVCESLACPKISSRAGSETKKNRGNTRRFFSRYLNKKQYQNNKENQTNGVAIVTNVKQYLVAFQQVFFQLRNWFAFPAGS